MKVYTISKAYKQSDILHYATDNEEKALALFNTIMTEIKVGRLGAIGVYVICWEENKKPTIIREWYK